MDAIADKLGWDPKTARGALERQPELKTDQWQDGRFYQRVNFSVTEIRGHQLLI